MLTLPDIKHQVGKKKKKFKIIFSLMGNYFK
jgi:hypothetical protein